MGSPSLLIQKLDVFIRKYYLNRLIRGVLFGGGVLLGSGLFLFLLEYFGNFGIAGKNLVFLGVGGGWCGCSFPLHPMAAASMGTN